MVTRGGMMARLALLVGIVLSTAGAQYSCSSDGNGIITDRDLDSGEGPTFSTTLVLRDSAGAETYSFSRLELIDLELNVRNRTENEVRLKMPSTAASEFFAFIEGADTPRWRSNDGKAFPTIVTEIVFQPHESKVFTLEWNQELLNGTFLPRGTYEARGTLPRIGFPADPLEPHELGSNLRVFTVN